MSTIGNSSGHLSIHTQISPDIVGDTSKNGSKKSSDKIGVEREKRKSNHANRNNEGHRSEHAKNKKMHENHNSESRTAVVDRELEEKMLEGNGSKVTSHLQSQVQSNPGSLASMQLSKLSMNGGIAGTGSKEDSMKAFEAYMVQMMMKEMRKTLPKGAFGSNSMDMFMDMFDQAIAEQMAQRGGIGLSDSLERQFQSRQESTTGGFSSQQGFSSSKHEGGETSSFTNTSQDLDSRQIAMKLKKMGVSTTHLEKFQNMYQTWKAGEKIDTNSYEQNDDVWRRFTSSDAFRNANLQKNVDPFLDKNREQLVNKMIIDDISLSMMDPSMANTGFEQSGNEFGSSMGIERVYGLDINLLTQDPWKLQQILNQRNYQDHIVDPKNSHSNLHNHDVVSLDNASNTSVENFEGGIESFYESRNGVSYNQPEYGMSSNEMKNIFHSISMHTKEHDEHVHSSTELQPFLPLKGTAERDNLEKNNFGKDISMQTYQFPVSGRVSSSFGMRVHPISRQHKHHDGMDIAAPKGSSIKPIADGTVISSGVKGGYGNVVVIEHDNGLTSMYAHCDELLVSVGEQIRKNMTIAKVGSTGFSTGPHLHLEIRKDGILVNPVDYIGTSYSESIDENTVPLTFGNNS